MKLEHGFTRDIFFDLTCTVRSESCIKSASASFIDYRELSIEILLPTVHPRLQFLPHLEERQLLRPYLYVLAGLGISAGIRFVMPDCKTPESPELNPSIFLQGICEPIENHVHDVGSLIFWSPSFAPNASSRRNLSRLLPF